MDIINPLVRPGALPITGMPLWQRLGLIDLGARARDAGTLGGASVSYRGGLTVLDVQAGNTPQASVAIGQIGTLIAIIDPLAWDPVTQGVAGLWRGSSNDSVLAIFEYPGDNQAQIWRSDDVGANAKTLAYDASNKHVVISTWSDQHVIYLDGVESPVARAGSTWVSETTLNILHDPANAGSEIKGKGSVLYLNRALTQPEAHAITEELLRQTP